MNELSEKSELNQDLPSLAEGAQSKELPSAAAEDAAEDANIVAPAANRQRNVIIGIVTGIALLLIIYFFFWRNNPNLTEETTKTAEPEVTVSVKTVKATRTSLAQEFSAVGTVSPVQQSTVSAALGAQITQMRLLKNNFVRAGDLIAVLNSADLQAQRAEAVAALQEAELNRQTIIKVAAPQANAQAEKDLSDAVAAVDNARVLYERRRDLYNKGGIALNQVEASQLVLRNAENNLKLIQKSSNIRVNAAQPNDLSIVQSRITQAQNRIKNLDAQINLTVVRAPLSGVVTDQFQFQGEYAAAGARLVSIANISEVIVKASFADTVISKLKLGDAVKVLPNDLAGEEMNGKITNIARSADPLSRTVEVWVNLGNGAGRLRAGSAAQIAVSANEESDAVVIPAAAVTLENADADEGTVMVVGADQLAHTTKIKIGIRNGDKIQVTEGLSGNEKVIVTGNYSLPDKTKVEATEAESADESGETPKETD